MRERLDEIESEEIAENNMTIEGKFENLSEEHAKKTDSLGNKIDKNIWDNITQEEIDYYKNKNLQISPEEDYQDKKKHWYFHESSWYRRGLNSYDGYGCNQFTGCILKCRFYPEYGRIEDNEILKKYERKDC